MANWDITFCSQVMCEHEDCYRHLKSENARTFPPYRPMYVANFKDMCDRYNLRGDSDEKPRIHKKNESQRPCKITR